MTTYTPMMQQFIDIKSKHQDSILFFRMGDFYEMFLDDALEASKILGITLTARDAGAAGKVPMCGVPYHAADGYIAKLINVGRKVAICEQVEDPAQSKGLVRREVVRIVTPATHHDAAPDTLNYVISWHISDDEVALAAVEYLTGSIVTCAFCGPKALQLLAEEIVRLGPKEAAVPCGDPPQGIQDALSYVASLCSPVDTVSSEESRAYLDLHRLQSEIPESHSIAVAQALKYLEKLAVGGFGHFDRPRVRQQGQTMALDLITRRNLELTRTMRSDDKEGSLLWVLDHTVTSMGTRLLRQWIEQPLLYATEIEERLDAVEELVGNLLRRQQLRSALDKLYDMERLGARIASGAANARDVMSLGTSLQAVDEVQAVIGEYNSPLMREIAANLFSFPELCTLISDSIVDTPPLSLREGDIIRSGYDPEVDRLRSISKDGKKHLAALESKERENSGIKSMKIGFNKVFGYYLEVTRSNLDSVPDHYVRKQTLVNAERYITEELKEYEQTLTTAEERLKALEYDIFLGVRDKVAASITQISGVARRIAQLDVLQSMGEASSRFGYKRPVLNPGQKLSIESGRHPVVERMMGSHSFVPNDTMLGKGEIAVITGPNMAGKSTYMRQVALVVLMAQMGCFVPAERANIPLVDRVFTRVGASDDLFSGQSTFMVEMTETSVALRESTERSLILFDEVGRGTSTYDGMALAQSIMEYVHDQIRAMTLFSTHYHELTSLAENLPRCKNLTVAIMERGKEVVFLRRVQPGKASKSYGIHVAELAGLPDTVTERAYHLLRQLEQQKKHGSLQLSIFDLSAAAACEESTKQEEEREQLLDTLAALSCEAMTPLQALNVLTGLVDKVRKIREL